MPLFETKKTTTQHLLIEADSQEEAERIAAATPERECEESATATTVTVEEVEVPF